MKRVSILVLISLTFGYKNYAQDNINDKQTLTISSKEAFDKAKPENLYTKDNHIKKKGTELKIAECLTLKDNESDKDFYEFDYIGDLDTAKRYRIIRKTLYNGEEYRIVDVLNKCKVYNLLGKPHTFDDVIINFNESETTDKKKVIEIWKITSNGIIKLKNVLYTNNPNFVAVRYLDQSTFVIKDAGGNYWKIED